MKKFSLSDLLARFAIDGAKTGKVQPHQGRMCSGCAFRKGTPANSERPPDARWSA